MKPLIYQTTEEVLIAVDFKDYYNILGIEPDASPEDIKRTYKKLARKYHPDVSDDPDAQSKFQEVSEAYEVLRNKEKREEYDELRDYVNNPNKYRGGGDGQYYRFDSDFSAEDQFADLLRSIFGDHRGAAGAGGGDFASAYGGFEGAGRAGGFRAAPRDSRHSLKISLEEAYSGGTRTLRLSTPSGEKTINVKIPEGVADGKELRLRGQSGDGGDLYLKLEIEPHSLYGIDGQDITLTVPVAPWEAALGATVPVPTLGGKVNLKVPANSQAGRKLRLKGRGLAGGDQIVQLQIVNPPAGDDEAKAAFEALAKQFDFDPRAAMKPGQRA